MNALKVYKKNTQVDKKSQQKTIQKTSHSKTTQYITKIKKFFAKRQQHRLQRQRKIFMYNYSKMKDIQMERSYADVQQIVECYLTIDIDTDINESSISKKYKWITSLELISSDQFKNKQFAKERDPKQYQTVKHFQIDKLLYLVVTFCEEGKQPIARIRTRRQHEDSDWKMVPYPKEFQNFYEHNICYQYTQSKQCKRIITDIEVCHSKELENTNNTEDQWEIATIPELTFRLSKTDRPTLSESEQSQQRKSHPFDFPQLDSKFSQPSELRQNHSNISENSYYSCNDNEIHSKSSIEKDNFSDLDQRSPSHHSNQMQSKKSSLSQFHSIEQMVGPFYFLMKTIDLYDYHNEFQYNYEPKIIQVHKAYPNSKIEQKYLRALSKFCFPNGIKLTKKISGCGFQTFTLILTTEQGQRYFAYCLKYKQKMAQQTQKLFLKQLYELRLIGKDEIYKNQTIFNEKAFCLISKIQNTDIFHKILENLYRALLSFNSPHKATEYFPNKIEQNNPRNLEFFVKDLISSLQLFGKSLLKKERRNLVDPVKTIPLPSERSQLLEYKWCGVTTNFPKREAQNKVSMKAMYCLFKLLSVDNILKILEAALLEKKIFIVSSMQCSIFLVIEALIGLIHPLRLSQPIIPIISSDLIDCIEAPIPLVAGISDDLVNENTLTKAVYAFVDCNKILPFEELPTFPIALNKLSKALKKIQLFNSEHVIEYLNFKEEVYSLSIHEIEEYNSQMHDEIKNLFKNHILEMIKNYASCYSKTAQETLKRQKQTIQKPTKQVQSERTSKSRQSPIKSRRHMTFKEMYNSVQFIKEHQKKDHPFYEEFCNSSIFKNLIQQKYTNPESSEIKLIDKAIQHLDDEVAYHFSCFSIPTSSLKKESLEKNFDTNSSHLKSSAVKAKARINDKKVQERCSLTNIKEQTMKKNFSNKQQQKNLKRSTLQQRKATNVPYVPQARQTAKKQKSKASDIQPMHSQRLSEGAVHTKNSLQHDNPKLKQENSDNHEQRSVGFRICSMVTTVTKKITESKTNIINIFSEAKVNRLKKAFQQQNKQKGIQYKPPIVDNEKSYNIFFNMTAPQVISAKNHSIKEYNQSK